MHETAFAEQDMLGALQPHQLLQEDIEALGVHTDRSKIDPAFYF
ncbi:hypothetical protein [Deinococcus pimensis]|nr:hypothetical protein [Deinococcus pimensis]